MGSPGDTVDDGFRAVEERLDIAAVEIMRNPLEVLRRVRLYRALLFVEEAVRRRKEEVGGWVVQDGSARQGTGR